MSQKELQDDQDNQEATDAPARAAEKIQLENAGEPAEVFLAAEEPKTGDSPDERFVRLMADFDNFRRRTAREHAVQRQLGRREAIEKILPVFDALGMGLLTLKKDDPYRAGMEAVRQQLLTAIESLGAKRVKTVGENFDPNQHEAIGQMPSATYKEGVICEETRAGFADDAGLLRPAQVLVSSGVAGQ